MRQIWIKERPFHKFEIVSNIKVKNKRKKREADHMVSGVKGPSPSNILPLPLEHLS
jgi:hypothetical protein